MKNKYEVEKEQNEFVKKLQEISSKPESEHPAIEKPIDRKPIRASGFRLGVSDIPKPLSIRNNEFDLQ